jgi:hypothetical protein
MTRLLACSIGFFVIAIGIAQAVPARPLYEPAVPVTPAPLIVNLNGSSWFGKYITINRIFIFEADGTLSYRTTTGKAGGKIYKNRGNWKLQGNNLYFDYFTMPGRTLMEFRGIVTDGNTIVGEATYPVTGKKDAQTLKLAPNDGPK